MTNSNNGDNAIVQNANSPWMRLLRYVTAAFNDPKEGHAFATGMDFGFAIALRHPEYAAVMRQASQAELPPETPETDKLVDDLITAVPIEIEG